MSCKTRHTFVSNTKTEALARVLDLVPKGYTRYIQGSCPPGKLLGLLQKFHERYAFAATPAERLTRKGKGLANAVLVLFWPKMAPIGIALDDTRTVPAAWLNSPPDEFEEVPAVEWLLLVTNGEGRVTEEERLGSVLEKPRLSWLAYELVRHTARGKVSWTWRRSSAEMAECYAVLGDQLARRQTTAVAETLLRASRQPGFSGVRKQSRALIDFARQRGYDGEAPFLFHVQKTRAGMRLALPAARA
jgi:hypothetical protein